MIKAKKVIITFIISFIVSYLIVGYAANSMFVGIKWVENITIWGKLKEYYVRTASFNIVPTLILSIIATCIINYPYNKTNENIV
ncbi:hypothetical protein [Clostridium intestinale]|uniref:Uncharacterized protein n=1 Tax=Clostridium intestinale DSM 6191 TaxID=1121320 RepID=A0A1M5VZZ9_9CLOT|nr:hypothetical protein [Clostridium intestinale]SHH80909.1 hypothetical protein SAMN02745941_00868 [Clostridium intestinale DSM 6191]